jgi:hypothetical protein
MAAIGATLPFPALPQRTGVGPISSGRSPIRRAAPQIGADGGCASEDNLTAAKALGVTDVAFHKKRGLAVEHMVKSRWVYRKLRNYRAGIEAGFPAPSEPTVWHAVLGAGSITSRPSLASPYRLVAEELPRRGFSEGVAVHTEV